MIKSKFGKAGGLVRFIGSWTRFFCERRISKNVGFKCKVGGGVFFFDKFLGFFFCI